MAGLVRLRFLPKMINKLQLVSNNKQSFCRYLSTSSAQKTIKTDPVTGTKSNTTAASTISGSQKTEPVKKNWISYGFSDENEIVDRHGLHLSFFVLVTITIMLGGYVIAYYPDFRHRDWAIREGYIQLREREAKGLPRIDINFIDPSKFTLPSDEELGDMEIII